MPQAQGPAAFFPMAGVHLLQTLQVENVRLTQENRRMNQLEADRLRFEQASRDAWEKVTQFKKVNDELRAENVLLRAENVRLQGRVIQLEEHMKKVDEEIKKLQRDPLLLEVAQLMNLLEEHVVLVISDHPSFLSDINLISDVRAVEKWKQHFRLDSKQLFAFKTIMSAIKEPRKNLAHPAVDPAHVALWKITLRNYCPRRVSDESIQVLVDMAVRVLKICV